MKNKISIIFLLLFSCAIVFSNERKQETNKTGISFSVSDNDSSTNKFTSSTKMKDPEQMIRLGRYLTMTGVSSFSTGVIFISAAVILSYFAWNEIDSSKWNETYDSKKNFWYSLMMQRDNPKLTWLTAFALGSFVMGGLTLLLSILVIPGIVLWAVGAGSRVKNDEDAKESSASFKPFLEGNSLGLSINL